MNDQGNILIPIPIEIYFTASLLATEPQNIRAISTPMFYP